MLARLSILSLPLVLGLGGCRREGSMNPPIEFRAPDPQAPAGLPVELPAGQSPPPAVPEVAAPATGRVRFVAYNLLNYLTDESPDGRQRLKPEREKEAIVEVLAALSPDILGVCEIGSEDDLIDLQRRLADAGVDLPHRTWTGGEDPVRHLGLLSAWPLAEVQPASDQRYELLHRDGSVALVGMERGILDVTVQLAPDYQLRCLGVHLKSKREIPEADQETMRRSEAQLLRRHAEKILAAAPETNLLVYGDFNDTLHTPAIEIIRGDHSRPSAQLEPLSLADPDGERWTHYWDFQDIYSRFDYCFVSPSLKPEIVLRESGIPADSKVRRASDHRPVFVTIQTRDR